MKQNKLFEERYNRVMNKVAKSVRTILERLDEDELAECFEDDAIEECGDMFDCENPDMNEMARKTRHSTIPSKVEAATRDSIMRRGWDEEWAKQTQPLAKWSAERTLQAYVFGLLLLNKECPKTVADIDKIGVYAKYAHRFLDEGGTMDEIIALYNEQDPVTSGKRSGAKRAVKAYRKPAEEFDFDNVENNTTDDEEVVVDDEIEVNVDEIEDQPEVDVNDEESNDFPDYDDVDIDDVEGDELDINDDADINDEEEVANDENEIVISNIDDVTYEQYMDPAMNVAFSEFYGDDNKVVSKNGGVQIPVKIVNSESNESGEYVVTGESFGEVLGTIYALIWASYDSNDQFFEIRVDPSTKWLIKKFSQTSDDLEEVDEIQNKVDEIAETCINGAKSVADVVERLTKRFK